MKTIYKSAVSAKIERADRWLKKKTKKVLKPHAKRGHKPTATPSKVVLSRLELE